MWTSDDRFDVRDRQQLRALYDEPLERITRMKFPTMDDFVVQFIAASPIMFLSTRGDGGLDCSPRGGPPGFVRVLDQEHLAIPDWPGNNKLESLENILQSDGACGAVFLVPRYDAFLRVNGTLTLTRNPELLDRFENEGRRPKLAMVLSTREVYFHCGKALRRSALWQPDLWPGTELASIGTVIREQGKMADTTALEIDQHYRDRLTQDLY